MLGGFGVTFTSTSTAGGSASLVDWQWDFGDGATGTGTTVTHVFSGAGPWSVRLTVRDNLGVTGTVTVSVTAL